MSLSIHHPHDHFCKRALADVAVAKDLLSRHLPPAILTDIDWNTFRLTNKSFVNEKLKETHSDIIFQCMLGKDDCYLYLIVEHQSTPAKLLPFRQLSYNVLLMEQHLNEGNKHLPLIINICLYAGAESPYPWSLDPFDSFKNPQRARDLMFKSSILIDLTTISEETLETYGKADLLALLLKQAVQRDYLKWLQENKEKVFILSKRGYGVSGAWYILATDDKTEPDTLLKALI
jgi:predicted transposase/invertase (TIGR01784 family)